MKEIVKRVSNLGLSQEEAAAAVETAVSSLPNSKMTYFTVNIGENIVFAPYMTGAQ